MLGGPVFLFLVCLSTGIDSILIPFMDLLLVLRCLSGQGLTSLSELLLMLNSLLLFESSLVIVFLCPLLLLDSLLSDRLFPVAFNLDSSLFLLFDPGLSDLLSPYALFFSRLSDSLLLDSSCFDLFIPLASLFIEPCFPLFLVLSLSLDVGSLPCFLFDSALFDLFLSLDADGLVVFSQSLLAFDLQLILVLFSDLPVLLLDSLLSDALFFSLGGLIGLPVALGLLLLVPDSDLLLLVSVVLALLEPPLLVSLLIDSASFVISVASAFGSVLSKLITVFVCVFCVFFFFRLLFNFIIAFIVIFWFWNIHYLICFSLSFTFFCVSIG